MPETPEQIFARLMPGYDVSKAKRTKKGNPYWYEQGDFEPGTYGQRLEGKPHVRMSPKAQPWELPHEEEHVDQLYAPGGMEAIDQGYDEGKMSSLYSSFGLTPEDAGWLAYAQRPTELAARRAAGDPDQKFRELLARVEAMKARRAQQAPRGPATGGIGDPSRRR